MPNKEFSLTVASILIAIISLVFAFLFGTIANDLNEKVRIQEEEIQELEWELGEIDNVCQGSDK